MKKLAEKLHIPVKAIYAVAGIAAIVLVLTLFYLSRQMSADSGEADNVKTYNDGEQLLYDSVMDYLVQTAETDSASVEEAYSKVADRAVENYDTIIDSGVMALNNDHTLALQENIRDAILQYIPDAGEMPDEYTELLSANITEIIINYIMEQMEALSEKDTEEYEELYSSLEDQAKYLDDQEMNITITTSMKKGEKGDPGAQGEKGEKGDKGDPGAQGEKGEKGDTGAEGDKGDTGAQGEKGDKGDTGAQGEKGDKGDTGAQGVKGDTGAQGEKGDKGDTGEQGVKGDTGAQGEKGDKGDTGEQGVKGDTGAQGEKGDTGIQGEKGDTGEQGEKGDTGADGYTPVKGVDYFTNDDIDDMADKAASISETNLKLILGDQVTFTYDPNTKTLYINTK